MFSYGTLHYEDVQLSTFGRRLEGQRDDLPGFELSSVKIEEPDVATALGKTHHANAVFRGGNYHVSGTVFEVTEAELARVDEYEAAYRYERVAAVLASGRQAWVYVYAQHAKEE
jgi:gamma-glutamylcyclotransferase (GGCT)/AIG2-like uncharacterized protein YtfP